MSDLPRTVRPAGAAARPASARSRERILREAIRHFGELGPRAASVPAIARAAGFSHGRVYQLFGSKQALYRAACERDFADLLAEAAPGEAGRALPDRLLGRLLAVRAALPQHPLARRLLAGGEGELGELCELPAARALRAELRGELAAGARAGELPPALRTEAGANAVLTLGRALLLLPRPAGEGDQDPARSGGELLARLLRSSPGRTRHGG